MLTALPLSVALVALLVVQFKVEDWPLVIVFKLAVRFADGIDGTGDPLTTLTVILDVTLCEPSRAISTYSVVLDGETLCSPSDETELPFNVTDFAWLVDHCNLEERPRSIRVGFALRRALKPD